MAVGSMGKGSNGGYYTSKDGGGQTAEYYAGGKDHSGGGQWIGKGAQDAGLSGQVDSKLFLELMDKGKDPFDSRFGSDAAGYFGTSPRMSKEVQHQLAQLVAASPIPLTHEQIEVMRFSLAQQAVQTKLYDPTYSVEKSISLSWFTAKRAASDAAASGDAAGAALWESRAAATDRSVLAGADAFYGFLEKHAGFTRAGRHGSDSVSGRWLDAHALIGARYYERIGKSGDPQLHAHHPTAPRAVDSSGKAHALDGRLLYQSIRAAAVVGSLVTYTELAREEWNAHWTARADGYGYEMEGFTQQDLDDFSDSSKVIGVKEKELVAKFESRTGRQATPDDIGQLKSLATVLTRTARAQGIPQKETVDQMLDRVAVKADAKNLGGMRRMAAAFSAPRLPAEVSTFNEHQVLSEAVTAAQLGNQVWTPMDLFEQIGRRIGPVQDTSDWEVIEARLWGLVDKAIETQDIVQVNNIDIDMQTPRDLQRVNGESSFMAPNRTSSGYVTRGMMEAEAALLRHSKLGDRTQVQRPVAVAWIQKNCPDLKKSKGQYEALVGCLTNGAAVTNLVGLAGAGKTYVLARLAEAWPELTGGRVLGVATSSKAAQTMSDEGIPTTMNIAMFEVVNGQGAIMGPNDILAVDEAGTVGTFTAKRLLDTVNSAGARMIATGDPEQATSVEAGGWFDLLVEQGSHTYTLREVRRFKNEWEGPASARFRDGDTSVAAEYNKHHRLIGVDTRQDAITEAATRYVDARLLGKTAVVPVASNAIAAQVSAAIRQQFIDRGYLINDGQEVILGRDQNAAGIGDEVQMRLNDTKLGVTNRVNHRLTAFKADGTVVFANMKTGELVDVPAVYVQDNTQLAYSGSVLAFQGMTVEVGITLPEGMSKNDAYPALTRGTEQNIAIFATKPQDSQDRLIEDAEDRDPVSMMAEVIGSKRADGSATQQIAETEEQRRDPAYIHGRLEAVMERGDRIRLDGWLDRLEHDGRLSGVDRQRFDNGQSTDALGRQMRVMEQAGLDPEAVLRAAVTQRGFENADDVGAVVLGRVNRALDGVPPAPTTAIADVPVDLPEDFAVAINQAHGLLQNLRREYGSEAALAESSWVRQWIGPVPEDAMERVEWEDRAGRMILAEKVAGREDEQDKLGASPGILRPERRALWHDAHLAHGSPATQAQEREMTEGQLLMRVMAWERALSQSPDHVDGALKAAEEELQRLQHEEAEAITDNRGDDQAAAELAELEMKVAVQMWDEASRARDAWEKDATATRDAARRSAVEMDRRGIDPKEQPVVTAKEWAQAEAQRLAEQDERQLVDEHEVFDQAVAEGQLEDEEAEDDARQADAIPGTLTHQPQIVKRTERSDTPVTTKPDEFDQLAAARSLQAARAAADESAYLREQERALVAADPEWQAQDEALAQHEAAVTAQSQPATKREERQVVAHT